MFLIGEMTPSCLYLLRSRSTLGLLMQPVREIQGQWNIRPLTCRQGRGCFISAPCMVQTTLENSLLSFTPWLYSTNRAIKKKWSIQTVTMPFCGCTTRNAKQNWNIHHRPKHSIKLLPAPKTGYAHTISKPASSNGKPKNGERYLPTSAGNRVWLANILLYLATTVQDVKHRFVMNWQFDNQS